MCSHTGDLQGRTKCKPMLHLQKLELLIMCLQCLKVKTTNYDLKLLCIASLTLHCEMLYFSILLLMLNHVKPSPAHSTEKICYCKTFICV